MNYDALLVVDVQSALVDNNPFNKPIFLNSIQQLLKLFREQHLPVIYVRHNGGSGDELEYGTAGWEIASAVAPVDGEVIVDKQWNSAFRGTDLRDELSKHNAHRIVLCGMQSEYCIDTTCKVAFEYGYEVTIVQDSTTTFPHAPLTGEQVARFYEDIWNKRFADVISMDEFRAAFGQ